MTHPGKCKFCGAILQLEMDNDCPPTDINLWKPNAACNRCADFRMGLLKIGDHCCWLLGKLHDVRGSKAEKGVEMDTREKITEATKRMMRLCCDHYRVTNHWDHAVVDEIMENPNKVRFIISFMRNQVEKSARRAA